MSLTANETGGRNRAPSAFLWKVAKLLATLAMTFFGLLLVTFLIGRIVPVDPVLAVVGDRASQSVYDKAFIELGLDKPLYEQFWIYLQEDADRRFRPVLPDQESHHRRHPARLPRHAGTCHRRHHHRHRSRPADRCSGRRQAGQAGRPGGPRVLGLIGYSAPIFWLGLLGLLVFYAKLGWVAGPGRIDISYEYSFTQTTGLLLIDSAMQGQWDAFRNVVSHLLLPASLLGYYSMAYISRMTRSFMLNELAQEYITTARVKGVPEWRIIWVHALRNAAVPLVTVIALSYAGLLEGSVLTETVFAWPGLGQYLTNSLQNADMNAVLGGTLVIGVIFVGLNLLSDLLYTLLDPRVRRRG